MYYVVNTDGNQYGPASLETIQQWYQEGRVADSARFRGAATEEPVSRERLLPPVIPAQPTYSSPGQYPPPSSPYGQAYRDTPTSYSPQLRDNPAGYGYPPQPQLYGSRYAPAASNHSPTIAGLLAFFCFWVDIFITSSR